MARINIEDSIFKEKAFEKLVLRLGSRRAALGALVEAFMLAQKHYLTTVNDRLIPLNEWEREEMGNDLLDCGFCVQKENGIYVRGSEEQFKWLLQRSEAGKTSARNKQHLAENPVERPLNDRPTTADGSQPLTLTLPLSPTLPLSQTTNSVINNSSKTDNSVTQGDEEDSPAKAVAGKKPKKKKPVDEAKLTLNRNIWEEYRAAFYERYGIDPTRNGKVNANISQLGERLGVGAVAVVRFYVNHNDQFYIKNTHSIAFCLRDAESLMVQWQKGRALTGSDAKNLEKKSTMSETYKAILEGKV